VEKYRENIKRILKESTANTTNRGAWSPGCLFHCQPFLGYDAESVRWQAPYASGNTASIAFKKYMAKLKSPENATQPSLLFMDERKWPYNLDCNNRGDTYWISALIFSLSLLVLRVILSEVPMVDNKARILIPHNE